MYMYMYVYDIFENILSHPYVRKNSDKIIAIKAVAGDEE